MVRCGRKIGFTNRSVQAEFGIAAPLWGWMYEETVHAAGGAFPVAGLPEPRIEPEIQMHLAHTPRPGADEEEIARCVDWISHGFEVVACRYPGWRFTVQQAIDAGVFHTALLVGPPVPVAELFGWTAALKTFTVELLRDGEVVAGGGGANVLDGPLSAVVELARSLASSGGPPLRAGELLTTGTLTAAPLITTGETWSTRLTGLAVDGVSVTLG